MSSKGIKCIKHLVGSGTMQPSKFYSLPNTDGHTGHKIPALLFLADSLINSMTKKSTQNLTMYVEYEDFFFFLTWLWKKRMFLCLKVCTTGKSYIVLFFIFQCTFPMLKLLFFWRWDSILFKTLSQIITDLPGIFNSAVTQFFPNFKRLIHSKLLY